MIAGAYYGMHGGVSRSRRRGNFLEEHRVKGWSDDAIGIAIAAESVPEPGGVAPPVVTGCLKGSPR